MDDNSLVSVIVNDLREQFHGDLWREDLMDRVGRDIKGEIIKFSSQETNPDGSPREVLSNLYAKEKEKTVGNRKADLIGENQSLINDFDYSVNSNEHIGYDFGANTEADEYMGDHELGANGMPMRRFFPQNADEGNAPYDSIRKMVQTKMSRFLNKPKRTVKIKIEVP